MTVLYDIGGKAGGLRALTQYLRLAGMTAKGQGTVITLDLIFNRPSTNERSELMTSITKNNTLREQTKPHPVFGGCNKIALGYLSQTQKCVFELNKMGLHVFKH